MCADGYSADTRRTNRPALPVYKMILCLYCIRRLGDDVEFIVPLNALL